MTAPLRFPAAASPEGEESRLRGRTWTSGFSDGLGERFLAHGASDEPVLEVLRFKPELSDSPDFEKALRARVDVLRPIKHASLAAIHSVERPEGLGLCLVSEHIAGRRLSELAPADLGPAFGLDLIRTVTPMLCVLNQTGVGIAHGALSAERIVVATDGRLVVVEQALGWALESLRFPRQRLNELGIVVGAWEPGRFDGRTDMMQLGFLALSVFLRRRLDPADCPAGVPALLDGSAEPGGSLILPARLRVWLERALQVGHKPFASPHEAVEVLDELHDDTDLPLAASDALLEFPSEFLPELPAPTLPTLPTPPAATPPREAAAVKVAELRGAPVAPVARPAPPAIPAVPAARVAAPAAPAPHNPHVRSLRRLAVWILAAVSLVAAGEAIALVFLSYNQRSAGSANPSPVTPAAAVESSAPPASSPANPQTGPAGAPADPSAPGTVSADSANSRPATRSFSLTITSALQLQVTAGGRFVGTTPLSTTLREGTHQIELVNDALEFRQTQTVRVGSGQPRAIRITPPNGQISLNATPWAEVTIDGVAVGETPIANYSLPIGRHEIVFRHPQLGLRRQSVLVKAVTPLRVTEAFHR